MEILLIGNGFDLAHKLPTQYKDFLEFTKIIKQILLANVDVNALDWGNVQTDIENIIKEEMGNKRDNLFSQNKVWKELLEKNLWVNYFLNCSSFVGENWIDFESEISRVIQIFDEVRQRLTNEESIEDFNKQKSGVIMSILVAAKGNLSDVARNTELFDKFLVRMEKELNQLIRALEIYLVDFVGKISISKKVLEIEGIDPDHILSFNYTDTYKRTYGIEKKIEYDYIHGKAESCNSIETNNMVLGIDEYLSDDKKDKDFTFLYFKKFYQRILKATDNDYLDWVDDIKDGYQEYLYKESIAYTGTVKSFKDGSFNDLPFQKIICSDMSDIACPEHTLYIFGHSLDVTDKDILKLFICNDNVQTKIFYYRKTEEDKSTLGKLIKNLISIMGQDELVRRTGGVHKTIEFIPQTIEE